MSYEKLVNDLAEDADQLEQLYLTAQKAGESAAFKQAIDESYTGAPGNLLYAAWFYRLRSAAGQARESFVQWAWVIPLAILNGVIFWWLSDDSRYTVQLAGRGAVAPTDYTQTLLLLAAPITAVFVLIYLTAAGRRNWRPAAVIGAILLASGAYVLWVYPRLGPQPFQEQYLTLSIMHLALLAWAGVGAFLIADHRDADNRFAFLSKSLEVAILGGLFLIAGGIFTGITVALFSALEVDFPVPVQRIFIAGGVGLIPVVAVGVLYNPALPPAEQSFDEGLSKLVALLMRVMLPLTLIVLVVYLAFIPFNFREPFDNRDVLVIYNGMLFAVMALLVGATPVSRTDLAAAAGPLAALGNHGRRRPGPHRQPVRPVGHRLPHRNRPADAQSPGLYRLECDQHWAVGSHPVLSGAGRCFRLGRCSASGIRRGYGGLHGVDTPGHFRGAVAVRLQSGRAGVAARLRPGSGL